MTPILRLAALICVVAAGAIGAFLARDSSVVRPLARVAATILEQPDRLAQPAPLSRHHASLPEAGECAACHDLTGAPPDAKCLACHEEISAAQASGEGWHADFEESCATCHRDHGADALVEFEHGAFNHLQARFDLRGAHRELYCASCHEQPARAGGTRLRWQGLAFDGCSACHDDPHAGALEDTCRRCHVEDGWSGPDLRFRHERDSDFHLVGAHATLECSGCHVRQRSGAQPAATQYRGTPRTCAACHDDPHVAGLEPDCTACHGQDAWTGRGLLFAHDRDSDFRLTGAHAETACELCHVPPESDARLAAAPFDGTPQTCAGCHDDPHAPTLGESCTACHGQTSWKGRDLLFRHDRDAEFALTGAHARVACAACHEPPPGDLRLAAAPLRGTPTACAACHTTPHDATVPADCARCHDTNGWTGTDLRLDHAAFPLRGAHASAECVQCHRPATGADGRPGRLATARFAGLETGCADCHEDPHRASLASRSCADCHESETSWTQHGFDHQKDSDFRLDAVHADLACAACHATPVYRPTPTACADCHTDVVEALAGRAAWAATPFPADPHVKDVACTDCHDTSRSSGATATAARCVTCHAEIYADLQLDRRRRLESLLLRVRRSNDLTDAERLRAERLRRLADHDFAPAERALRRLVDGDGEPR